MITETVEQCGFQGIDNLNTTQIKRWLSMYLLLNQRFESREEKEKAINTLYVKTMLFFQETDMRVNERNISNPDIQKKILDFAKTDLKKIAEILDQKSEMNTETIQTEIPIAPTPTEPKKPCGCGGHSALAASIEKKVEKIEAVSPNELECISLALLGALIAYLFVPMKFLFYVLGAIGLILLISIGKKFIDRKKAEEDEQAKTA